MVRNTRRAVPAIGSRPLYHTDRKIKRRPSTILVVDAGEWNPQRAVRLAVDWLRQNRFWFQMPCAKLHQ